MSQQAPGTSKTKGPMPDNHLVGAILATLFCCLPFGIVAIVQAAQVNGAYNAGNYAEAQRLADSANKWTMISVGIGLVFGVLYLMATVAGGG